MYQAIPLHNCLPLDLLFRTSYVSAKVYFATFRYVQGNLRVGHVIQVLQLLIQEVPGRPPKTHWKWLKVQKLIGLWALRRE